MSNKKISQLTNTQILTDSDEFAVVNGGETKAVTYSYLQKNWPNGFSNSSNVGNVYLVPTTIECASGGSTNLDDSPYNDCGIIYLTYTGGNGVHNLTLPDATTGNNTYRLLRFTCDDSIDSNHEVYLTPKSGQTLDGSAGAYQIDRNYEGIMIWSNGSDWIRIQTKA